MHIHLPQQALLRHHSAAARPQSSSHQRKRIGTRIAPAWQVITYAEDMKAVRYAMQCKPI